MSQLFAWGGQSTGVSALASFLPKEGLFLFGTFPKTTVIFFFVSSIVLEILSHDPLPETAYRCASLSLKVPRFNNCKEVTVLYHLWSLRVYKYCCCCSLQSCPTLWDPIDGSPPGSPIPGILQARTLEWVAISFSNAWKWKVKAKFLSRVGLLATPWTAAYQALPSMGFSKEEHWCGVPLPSLL